MRKDSDPGLWSRRSTTWACCEGSIPARGRSRRRSRGRTQEGDQAGDGAEGGGLVGGGVNRLRSATCGSYTHDGGRKRMWRRQGTSNRSSAVPSLLGMQPIVADPTWSAGTQRPEPRTSLSRSGVVSPDEQ